MLRHITEEYDMCQFFKENHKGFLVRPNVEKYRTGDILVLHSRYGADDISKRRYVLIRFLCNHDNSPNRVLVLKEIPNRGGDE